MNRSNTSFGTRQKGYVFPLVKRICMRIVVGSYPMASIADDETLIISIGHSFCEKAMRVESIAYHFGMNCHIHLGYLSRAVYSA